jgi:formamidopyrimidine-DNA glycosylase
MFELPELLNIAEQWNLAVQGKVIKEGNLGNSPHKFVWYNRKPEEFAGLARGRKVGLASVKGRFLSIAVEPGYVLLLGEFGGQAVFHPAKDAIPPKYHLYLGFEDGSFFTVLTQMWGAMELYEAGQEQNRLYMKDMRPTPVDPAFTFAYFSNFIEELKQGEKRSVKGLLTQEQLVPGLGNAIAQDILFRAGLHPKHSLAELDGVQKESLYQAIAFTVQTVTEEGGRYDETDLFGNPGGYIRLMDAKSAGLPCPVCETTIQKIQYLGGACYFCPNCQA